MFAEPAWRFPFIGMRVGDSFCIPTNDTDYMRVSILREARKFGIKVRTKVRVEDGVLVVRCWVKEDTEEDERPDA
jgi:hypothetical protein